MGRGVDYDLSEVEVVCEVFDKAAFFSKGEENDVEKR
jgi:hypothetical protein